jgi:hypothetical protein
VSRSDFRWRGVAYVVSGGWDSESGSYAGPDALIYRVERADGRPIRGARMCAGMQIGISRGLARAAERALSS